MALSEKRYLEQMDGNYFKLIKTLWISSRDPFECDVIRKNFGVINICNGLSFENSFAVKASTSVLLFISLRESVDDFVNDAFYNNFHTAIQNRNNEKNYILLGRLLRILQTHKDFGDWMLAKGQTPFENRIWKRLYELSKSENVSEDIRKEAARATKEGMRVDAEKGQFCIIPDMAIKKMKNDALWRITNTDIIELDRLSNQNADVSDSRLSGCQFVHADTYTQEEDLDVDVEEREKEKEKVKVKGKEKEKETDNGKEKEKGGEKEKEKEKCREKEKEKEKEKVKIKKKDTGNNNDINTKNRNTHTSTHQVANKAPSDELSVLQEELFVVRSELAHTQDEVAEVREELAAVRRSVEGARKGEGADTDPHTYICTFTEVSEEQVKETMERECRGIMRRFEEEMVQLKKTVEQLKGENESLKEAIEGLKRENAELKKGSNKLKS